MSGAWWTRYARPEVRPARGALAPELVPGDRVRLLADFDARVAGYTPEWTGRGPDDAGSALRQVFGEQLEAVARRLNRWPDKALGEFLGVAGIERMPGSAAEALLAFEVADGATQSVLVAPGYQAGARVPGVDAIVVFETASALYAAPGKLGEVFAAEGASFSPVDLGGEFLPFGARPGAASALWIGLTGDVAPTAGLTIYLGVAAPPGAPPPVGAGGVAPLPVPPGPVLRWELLDGGSFVELDLTRDGTAGLARSGLVELALPARWRPGAPAGMGKVKASRWLRLRIAYGSFARPTRLSALMLNVTRALGARTLRDEVPMPVPGSRGRRLQLSQTPVVPGTLDLQVDDSGLSGSGTVRWSAVPDLSRAKPDEAVYAIDYATGELSFGNGVQGRALPQGFRNVHAVSYQAQSPVPDGVAANAISVPITSVEFISKVTNPLPASGGGPAETDAQVRRRGPLEIRTRGRAVTPADYSLLALHATGAEVARAFAVPGLHPQYQGTPIPGVVGVFVVPPDRGEGAPTPDPETLRAVATSLSRDAAPAGVEVVAAAPAYHDVRVETGILLDAGANGGACVHDLLLVLSAYLHPLTGGEDGTGWPFGGTIRYARLLRRITGVVGVRAAPRLNVVLDGLRQPTCQDVEISRYGLLWPAGHQILILDPAGAS